MAFVVFCSFSLNKKATLRWLGFSNGASDRNRTGDNHVGNVMLYQLSYTRIACYAFKLDRFLQKANAETEKNQKKHFF